MRDHRQLEIFQLADELALQVYAVTTGFPAEERFTLVPQLRRAAISVAANIVEGAARPGDREFLRFLIIAYGSACELEYELSLAARLAYMEEGESKRLGLAGSRTCRAVRAMILHLQGVRAPTSGQRTSRPVGP